MSIHAALHIAQPRDDSDLGATILEVAYGIKAKDANDQYIVIGERAVEGPTKALVLGALWVEFIPALRHLPPWLPGASYQRKAVTWRQEATALRHEPFEKAMSEFVSNSFSYRSRLLPLYLRVYASSETALECGHSSARSWLGKMGWSKVARRKN